MIFWIIFLSLFCVVMSFERASLYYRLSELKSGLSHLESYVIFTVIFFCINRACPYGRECSLFDNWRGGREWLTKKK